MATHSSVFAWRIPGTGEPGGLLSMGSHRVGHDWSDWAAAAAYSSVYFKIFNNRAIIKNLSIRHSYLGYFWKQLFFFLSVQFSCSVVSDSLWPHGLQHARLPCLSPNLGACSNSCPSSWWCHPNITSSVIPFSSCLQSFPASGSFLTNQFFFL